MTALKRERLAGAKKSFKAAKMAAVRQIANATTAGFLGIEKKFLDVYKSDTAIAVNANLTSGVYSPTAGCTGCLSCPAQGDTEQSRDGKRIVIDALIVKGHVVLEPQSTAADFGATKVFVAAVLDTQTNGATCASELVFKNTAAQASSVVDPLKNLLSGNRFRILKSQVFDLSPADSMNSKTEGIQRVIDWYIPFKGGLPVNLNAGTTADVANVIDNSLHIIAFNTNAVQIPKLGYNARIRFQG